MKVLVSAIIPVYNTGRFLEECIESLRKQTLKEIEMIFINDGSTDNSLEILRKYEKLDNRIKVINQENKGPSASRNIGIQSAIGEYLSFIDADDWIESNMYEEMYNEAKKHNCELVISDSWEVYEEKRYIKTFSLNSYKYNEDFLEYIIKVLLSSSRANSLWNKIFKKEVININNILLDENLFYAEDWLFVLQFCLQIDKIRYIEKPFYYYRRGHESLSKSYGENTFEKTGLWLYNKRKEISESLGFYKYSGANELIQVLIHCIIQEGICEKSIDIKLINIKKLICNLQVKEAIENISLNTLTKKEKIILKLIKYKQIYCLYLYCRLAKIKSTIKNYSS